MTGGGAIGPGARGGLAETARWSDAAPAPRSASVLINQLGKTFVPHVLAIGVGDSVTFRNDDPYFHNVFSLSAGQGFDAGLYTAERSFAKTFTRPGPVELLCNIHASMLGYIYVVDSTYYTQPRPSGAFTIRNVPPGRYELSAWHESSASIVKQTSPSAPPGPAASSFASRAIAHRWSSFRTSTASPDRHSSVINNATRTTHDIETETVGPGARRARHRHAVAGRPGVDAESATARRRGGGPRGARGRRPGARGAGRAAAGRGDDDRQRGGEPAFPRRASGAGRSHDAGRSAVDRNLVGALPQSARGDLVRRRDARVLAGGRRRWPARRRDAAPGGEGRKTLGAAARRRARIVSGRRSAGAARTGRFGRAAAGEAHRRCGAVDGRGPLGEGHPGQ